MRLGFALPQIGQVAGPEALVAVAKRAEDLGFDSLWVLDRILWPVNPRAPYRSATVPQSKATAETRIPQSKASHKRGANFPQRSQCILPLSRQHSLVLRGSHWSNKLTG